jgi:hypothetical protein
MPRAKALLRSAAQAAAVTRAAAQPTRVTIVVRLHGRLGRARLPSARNHQCGAQPVLERSGIGQPRLMSTVWYSAWGS